MDAITGIKEEELKDLAIEILKYADNVSEILNKYDNKFYELDYYYEGKSYNDLKSFYNGVRDKFKTVNSNIVSYSDDLIALVRKMNEGADSLARLFNQFEQDKKDKARSVIDKLN